MLKYFVFILFLSTLSAYQEVERFEFDGHTYLKFECKTVLHDPECHRCIFQSYVIYDPHNLKSPLILQRVKSSPYHENFFHFDH